MGSGSLEVRNLTRQQPRRSLFHRAMLGPSCGKNTRYVQMCMQLQATETCSDQLAALLTNLTCKSANAAQYCLGLKGLKCFDASQMSDLPLPPFCSKNYLGQTIHQLVGPSLQVIQQPQRPTNRYKHTHIHQQARGKEDGRTSEES